jgi:hypothetical protein
MFFYKQLAPLGLKEKRDLLFSTNISSLRGSGIEAVKYR